MENSGHNKDDETQPEASDASTASSEAAVGAGLVSIGRTVSDVADILLIVVLTHWLDGTTFGLFAFTFMVSVTLGAIGPLGVPDAILYMVPKLGKARARAVGVWASLSLFGLALMPAVALVALGQPLADLLGEPRAAAPLAWVGVYALADFPARVLPNQLLGEQKYRGFFGTSVSFAAIRFGSIGIPTLLGYGLDVILGCFAATAWLRLLVSSGYFGLVAKGGLRRDGWKVRDLLTYGAPLAASSIVARLNKEVDKYMVFVLFTPAIYGVYVVGAQEVPLVTSIAHGITAALLPTLVHMHTEGKTQAFLDLWHTSMRKVSILMMPVFCFLFAVAEPLMMMVYGEAYGDAAIPFRVYLCLLPLRLCAYGGVVRALGKTTPVMNAAALGLVVNLVLNYPLFLAFGLAGPGLASILAQVGAIYWLLRCVRTELAIGWAEVFPYFDVAKTLGIAAVCALVMLPLFVIDLDGPLLIGAALVLYGALYLLVARWARILQPADAQYLWDLVSLKALRRRERNAQR